MILRPRPSSQSKPNLAQLGESSATDPRAPSGTQGWKEAGTSQGSTTLWRSRGRLARVAPGLRRDR